MIPIPIEGLLDKLISALAPGAVHAEQMGAYPMVEENETADAATDARQLAQLLCAHVLLAEGLVARLVVGHLHLVLLDNVVAHRRKVEGDVLVADLAPVQISL